MISSSESTGLTKVLLCIRAGATGDQSARRWRAPWMAVVDRPSRRASCDGEGEVDLALRADQPVQPERLHRLHARDSLQPSARASWHGAERAAVADAARTPRGRRRWPTPASRGMRSPSPAARPPRASRWWMSTCSMASCWSSLSPWSTTNRPPVRSASSSLATTSSAQLKSSSSMSEKSSRAVAQSDSASAASIRSRTAAPVGRVIRLRYGVAAVSRSRWPIRIVWIIGAPRRAPGW